jgi:hypothetical protein
MHATWVSSGTSSESVFQLSVCVCVCVKDTASARVTLLKVGSELATVHLPALCHSPPHNDGTILQRVMIHCRCVYGVCVGGGRRCWHAWCGWRSSSRAGPAPRTSRKRFTHTHARTHARTRTRTHTHTRNPKHTNTTGRRAPDDGAPTRTCGARVGGARSRLGRESLRPRGRWTKPQRHRGTEAQRQRERETDRDRDRDRDRESDRGRDEDSLG